MTFARKKEKSLIIVRATVRQPDFRISERTLLRIGRTTRRVSKNRP